MKKCLIFFTLFLISLGIAVITEQEEAISVVSDVAMSETTADNLLVEEQVLALDQ